MKADKRTRGCILGNVQRQWSHYKRWVAAGRGLARAAGCRAQPRSPAQGAIPAIPATPAIPAFPAILAIPAGPRREEGWQRGAVHPGSGLFQASGGAQRLGVFSVLVNRGRPGATQHRGDGQHRQQHDGSQRGVPHRCRLGVLKYRHQRPHQGQAVGCASRGAARVSEGWGGSEGGRGRAEGRPACRVPTPSGRPGPQPAPRLPPPSSEAGSQAALCSRPSCPAGLRRLRAPQARVCCAAAQVRPSLNPWGWVTAPPPQPLGLANRPPPHPCRAP